VSELYITIYCLRLYALQLHSFMTVKPSYNKSRYTLVYHSFVLLIANQIYAPHNTLLIAGHNSIFRDVDYMKFIQS